MLGAASEIGLDGAWNRLTAKRLRKSPTIIFRILQEMSFATFVECDRNTVSEKDPVLGR
jgi:hypothetical protein